MAGKLTATERAAMRKQYNKALQMVKKLVKPMVRRQERLTENDPELRDLRNQLIASCQQVGRIGGKDRFNDRTSLHGLLLTRTKKGNKPRAVGIDYAALGMTRKEAKKVLGGTTVKDLMKCSVQFTWRPYTRMRQGDEVLDYRGHEYGAADRERTVLVPYKVFIRFMAHIILDANKRGGIIPPGTFEHWSRVATSLVGGDFAGSAGAEDFHSFVNNNINKNYDPDEEDIQRPHQTVISIQNITYHNLNNQQPTQDIADMPFGWFARNMSHESLHHYTNDSDTWDGLIQPERTPADMEGLEGTCAIKGVWLGIRDSMYKTKQRGKKALDTPASSFRLDFRYMWDLAKNFVGYDDNRTPIFIPREDPRYRDYLTAEERKECDRIDYITDMYEVQSTKLADLRLTLNEAKRIFDHFYLNVVVRDEHGNMLWYCTRSYDNNRWRSSLDFIAKNGHLYLSPSKEDSRVVDRYQTLHKKDPERFSEPVTCSNRFKVPRPVKDAEGDTRLRVVVDDDWRTIPDLVAKTLSTAANPVVHFYVPTRAEKGKKGTVRYLNDLRQLYCLFKEKGFEAQICAMKDRAYGMLRLQRFITPLQPKGVVVNIEALSPGMTSIEEEDALRKARDALDRRIFIKTVMSTLSEEGRKYFKIAQGGAIGNLCEDPDAKIDEFGAKMVLEADIRAQQPYALSRMKRLPVYNNFDNPLPYDKEQYKKDYGHTYEFYTSYLVEFHVPNHMFRSQGRCSGMELSAYKPWEYTITHYFRPSKLVPSHVFNEMANFLENSGLDEKISKAASVPVCGKMGKQCNKSNSITHFETKNEMQHYRRRYKGSVAMVTTVDEKTYYTVARHLSTELVEGFRPIYFMMLGLSRLQQWQNIQQIRKKAIILQSVTDAVRFLIPKNADICPSVIRLQQEGIGTLNDAAVLNYFGLGDQMVDKSKPYREQAGQLKVLPRKAEDVKGAYSTNLFSRCVERFEPPRTVTPTVTRFYLPDEFDVEGSRRFLVELMEKYRKLNVVGSFPGVGKSFACKLVAEHVIANKGKVISLAQYWENVQEFRELSDDFRSLYSAFSVAFNGEDLDHMDENGKVKNNSKKKPIRFNQFKLVIIDEIFTADIVSLKKIVDVLFAMYPDIWVITNGDVGQLPAVNTAQINNIPEHMRRAYSESIVNGLFPQQLVIREVKRARCVKHQVTYTLPEIRDCADCQVKRQEYVNRVETIRNAKDVKDAFEKLKVMFSKNILTSLDQLEEKGITAAVSYTNSCAEVANTTIHADVSRKAGHKGKMYWPGMSLIAKRGMKLAQVEGKEDEEVEDDIEEVDEDEVVSDPKKKDYVRIYTNHMYKVTAVQRLRLKLVDPEYEKEGFWVKRQREGNALSAQVDHFVLPYCRTGHSFQGKTINEPFCIFEGDHHRVTLEWLVVACTRNIDPDMVYIYTGTDYLPLKTDVDKRKEFEMAQREIAWHKKADEKEFGSAVDEEGDDRYPTPEEYLETLRNTETCSHPECHNFVSVRKGKHSYDRVNGGVRHWISNCRFLCSVNCNSSMRPAYGL